MQDRQSYYVGVKAIVADPSNRVLVLNDTSHVAKWELIGGRVDKGGEIKPTLAREIEEEIVGAKLTKLGSIIHAAQGDFDVEDGYKLLLLFYPAIVKLPNTIKLSHEHQDLAWIDEKSIDNYDLYSSDKEAILKYLSKK